MKKFIFIITLSGVFSLNTFSTHAQTTIENSDGYSQTAEINANDYFESSLATAHTNLLKNIYPASGEVENLSVQLKFSQLLNRDIKLIKNINLYNFITEWMHTRYRLGGCSKTGIDCSSFTGLLLERVYDVSLPRTAREQYRVCDKIAQEEMLEGDLIFFNTRGGISHVGVYLGDDYFVHASSSSGVVINHLSEVYYKKRFIGGGRFVASNNFDLCKNLSMFLQLISF